MILPGNVDPGLVFYYLRDAADSGFPGVPGVLLILPIPLMVVLLMD